MPRRTTVPSRECPRRPLLGVVGAPIAVEGRTLVGPATNPAAVLHPALQVRRRERGNRACSARESAYSSCSGFGGDRRELVDHRGPGNLVAGDRLFPGLLSGAVDRCLLVEPCIEENSVPPQTDALEALKKMTRDGRSRLLVVEDGQLRGVISLKDVSRLILLKLELEE